LPKEFWNFKQLTITVWLCKVKRSVFCIGIVICCGYKYKKQWK